MREERDEYGWDGVKLTLPINGKRCLTNVCSRYAAEYHVERYMRECFVPRLAPVSRVSLLL